MLGVGDGLALGNLADQPVTRLRKADNRRRRPASLLVGDDNGLATLHDGHDRVRSAKVDTNDLAHFRQLPFLRSKDCGVAASALQKMRLFLVLNISVTLSTILMRYLLLFVPLILQTLHAQQLIIAAAADLAPLERNLTEAFVKETGLRVRFSLGSSGMLARQIANGAPFDAYLSANEGFVQELTASGHLDPSTVKNYATGRLGLWSASGKVKTIKDLHSLRSVAIASPKHAPYGMAAEELLRSESSFGQLQSKLVLAENVRQAFEFARTGNTDAVLTAWTLLHDKGGILLPDSGHKPISQSGGVVKRSKNQAAARRFMEFLTGPKVQAILQAGGLFPPR
jgi:molybdate transport system substrate-binding protein